MNYRLATTFAILCSAFLVAAILLAGSLASTAMAQDTDRPDGRDGTEQSAPHCYEDEPCWRWSTMGNLKRGVILKSRSYPGGVFRIVEPCDFAYLDMKGRIDWKRTKRLKGDSFARKHGCNPYLYA